MPHEANLTRLLADTIGVARADALFGAMQVADGLLEQRGDDVSRAVLAQALNMLLFEDLVTRVPAAAAYVADCRAAGARLLHDHGAVRTIALEGMGALPAGIASIVRLLAPLGYELAGTYPLDRIRMTGRSYTQVDYPEAIAQFFVSELHVDRLAPATQKAIASVTATSHDPLSPAAAASLAHLSRHGALPYAESLRLLPVLVSCFGRQHDEPALADYETILADTAEGAWIATEGNAFNHATDRVADVEALAERQKALGRPMKPEVEISATGRVKQTAFLAARVERGFVGPGGERIVRSVPGSFYEFITRLPKEDKTLDLGFDPSNAQGIFAMTAGQAKSSEGKAA
jgi:hypothetical protein